MTFLALTQGIRDSRRMFITAVTEVNLENLKSQGYNYFCGIDEAGRGPLAGPVTAAAVCFAESYYNALIYDSKKLSEKKREQLFEVIKEHALAYAIVSVGAKRIDNINILNATKHAMRLCATKIQNKLIKLTPKSKTYFLVDGNASLGNSLAHQTIIKGDAKVLSIAAASILAKVTRDRLMALINARYPTYKFSAHKGYPTVEHRNLVLSLGPSPVHRRSFRVEL